MLDKRRGQHLRTALHLTHHGKGHTTASAFYTGLPNKASTKVETFAALPQFTAILKAYYLQIEELFGNCWQLFFLKQKSDTPLSPSSKWAAVWYLQPTYINILFILQKNTSRRNIENS